MSTFEIGHCKDCVYFLAINDEPLETWGHCRFNAPIQSEERNELGIKCAIAVWPPVDATDWCGQWKYTSLELRHQRGDLNNARKTVTT